MVEVEAMELVQAAVDIAVLTEFVFVDGVNALVLSVGCVGNGYWSPFIDDIEEADDGFGLL